MVELVTSENRESYDQLLDRMFEDRKSVFIDLLKWDLPHDGYRERDEFDGPNAEYLIIKKIGTSEHIASLRILHTHRAHLLGSLFAQLCDGAVPSGPHIREISRMCLSPRHRGRERAGCRHQLASAMTEYALLAGIRAYTAVTDVGRMGRLLSIGWRCEPLGMPLKMGGATLAALMIHIEPDTIRRLQVAGSYHSCALRMEECDELAA